MDPKPSLLLTASAALYFVVSVSLLFASEELLGLVAGTSTALEVVLLQLLAAALFGFAMLNWLGRHSRIGGIFGRPLLVANLTHTAVAALTLGHVAVRGGLSLPLGLALGAYGSLAVCFGARLSLGPR